MSIVHHVTLGLSEDRTAGVDANLAARHFEMNF